MDFNRNAVKMPKCARGISGAGRIRRVKRLAERDGAEMVLDWSFLALTKTKGFYV